MQITDILVKTNTLKIPSQPYIIAGSVGIHAVRFIFENEAEWANLNAIAVFSANDIETEIAVLDKNVTYLIPHEITAKPSAIIKVGIYGTNTTNQIVKPTMREILCLSVADGTNIRSLGDYKEWPSVYAELIKQIEQNATIATEAINDVENIKTETQQVLSDLLSMLGEDIATLVGGKIPASQIPSIATTEIYTATNVTQMSALQVQNGDICIRTDENKSYIYNNGWVYLASPTDYAERAGTATTAETATNASMINNKRIVSMTDEQYASAVKDENTYYFVTLA